jgi:hypothetical protein
MNEVLIGKILQIGPGDVFASTPGRNPFEEKTLARIVAVENKGTALAVEFSLKTNSFTNAIIIPRHEGVLVDDLLLGKSVLCAVTLVSRERFSPDHPFDLSWWRGGNAAVADVVLVK